MPSFYCSGMIQTIILCVSGLCSWYSIPREYCPVQTCFHRIKVVRRSKKRYESLDCLESVDSSPDRSGQFSGQEWTQGGVLSSRIWNLAFDPLLKLLNHFIFHFHFLFFHKYQQISTKMRMRTYILARCTLNLWI